MKLNCLIGTTTPTVLILGVTFFVSTICLCNGLSSGRAAAEDNIAIFACADLDIKAFAAIEDRGAANDLPDYQLSQAGLLLLEARQNCYEGKVRKGVERYNEIIKLAPVNRY